MLTRRFFAVALLTAAGIIALVALVLQTAPAARAQADAAREIPEGAPGCDVTEHRFRFPQQQAPSSRLIVLGGDVVLTVLRGEEAIYNN